VRQLYLKEKDIKRHIVREIQTDRKREREKDRAIFLEYSGIVIPGKNG
jgi:hypothetical protein